MRMQYTDHLGVMKVLGEINEGEVFAEDGKRYMVIANPATLLNPNKQTVSNLLDGKVLQFNKDMRVLHKPAAILNV